MSKRLDSIVSRMNYDMSPQKTKRAEYIEKAKISDLIQEEQYVGEVVNLAYQKAKIQINDSYRKKVGGVPAQCFLIATRLSAEESLNELSYDEEDCSVILLRVIDSTTLPGDMDKERILVEAVSTSHGEKEHWDSMIQDVATKNMMSFGALQCRVIGTFYMDEKGGNYTLNFGNDLSNFYPNRGLKVYKPSDDALSKIVNYGINKRSSVRIGKVRYSSTNRKNQGVSGVSVDIDPNDLISQKTAVFGMTRTGKSNTVKMIAKSIYQLRQKANKKIGQLILDVNGEYANENVQDVNDEGKAQALKNVWEVAVDGQMGSPEDVVTYGLMKNANDPERIVMKINFYDDSLLQIGKELIDDKLQGEANNNVQYIKSFLGINFEPLEGMSHSEATREKRRRLIYKTILATAGLKDPDNGIAKSEGSLFSEDLLEQLKVGIKDIEELSENKQKECMKRRDQYRDCAETLFKLKKEGVSYSELSNAFEIFQNYITDIDSTYYDFERKYTGSTDGNGQSWLDVHTSSLFQMFMYKNSFRKLAKAGVYHDPNSAKKDYAHMIYEDLALGKLVIIDQALGDSDLNKRAAERILRKIFDENNRLFSDAQKPSEILIYVEEAHNLMPRGSEEDTTNIWARVAKEGAKFNIGMIYSTQEVSSIQKNILKNTTNWFISHLNNREEIRALSDFYDFEDFASSILQAEDKGFIRMKTKSNKFVVPIQVEKFQIEV